MSAEFSPKFVCEDCGWRGGQSELSPSVKHAPMDDHCGPFCPKCGSDALDDDSCPVHGFGDEDEFCTCGKAGAA